MLSLKQALTDIANWRADSGDYIVERGTYNPGSTRYWNWIAYKSGIINVKCRASFTHAISTSTGSLYSGSGTLTIPTTVPIESGSMYNIFAQHIGSNQLIWIGTIQAISGLSIPFQVLSQASRSSAAQWYNFSLDGTYTGGE